MGDAQALQGLKVPLCSDRPQEEPWADEHGRVEVRRLAIVIRYILGFCEVCCISQVGRQQLVLRLRRGTLWRAAALAPLACVRDLSGVTSHICAP